MTNKDFVLSVHPMARALHSEATKRWTIRNFLGRLMGLVSISPPLPTQDLAWAAAAERIRGRRKSA